MQRNARKYSRLVTLTGSLALTLAALGAASAQTNLERALSLLPDTTEHAYFNDWSLMFEDMLTVWPETPVVGDDQFIRAFAARHAPSTSAAIAGSGGPWLIYELWGFSLLDLAWELEANGQLTVVGFSDGFDPTHLLGFIAERDYATEAHREHVIHSRGFNPSLPWLRPPFFMFQNLSYLPGERILLLATDPELIRSAIDTYEGSGDTWLGGARQRGVVADADGAHSLLLINEAPACGGVPADESLGSYELALLGYQRSGDEVSGTVILVYADAAAAAADLAGRTRVATEGADTRGRAFSDLFQVATSEVSGNAAVLRLAAMRSPGLLNDLVMMRGASFLACAEARE